VATKTELTNLYRAYIACLNGQDWSSLGRFVDEDVRYNGERIGLDGYRGMLKGNVEDIPDLRFTVDLLVADPPYVGSRLAFDCTPKAEFLALPVNGRRVTFTENVFYQVVDRRIAEVWSVIDKAAIEGQLQGRP